MFLGLQQTGIRIPESVRVTVKYQIVRVQQYYRVDSTLREVRNINVLLTATPWLTYQCLQGKWRRSVCDTGLDAGRFVGKVVRERVSLPEGRARIS